MALRHVIIGIVSAVATALLLNMPSFSSGSAVWVATLWIIAQFSPFSRIRLPLQHRAWYHWEKEFASGNFSAQPVPTVNVQEHLSDLDSYIVKKLGRDWRKRPLLLQNLWSALELSNPHRRLSVTGLLNESMSIPYFTDSRRSNALSPDGRAPVRDIMRNITEGQPHKIGTQLLIQQLPGLIGEVAPTQLLTSLFGDYFTPDRLRGTGPWHLLPALTTVPLFVASGNDKPANSGARSAHPYTALHCEPIGNVAVQLSGEKAWTLVDPDFSLLLRPHRAPDGRAFFASAAPDLARVPRYEVVTKAGDAVWVPTWTWHRVDYRFANEVALGASLFHFRPYDFVRNNPLFAILMLPAMLIELFGLKTQ